MNGHAAVLTIAAGLVAASLTACTYHDYATITAAYEQD